MTYAEFLLVFLVVPLAATILVCRRALRGGGWRAVAWLLPVVYAFATPWDHVALAMGLWRFAPDRIWGIHLGLVPLEEVLFFGLQAALVGCWVRWRLVAR